MTKKKFTEELVMKKREGERMKKEISLSQKEYELKILELEEKNMEFQ